MRKIDVVKVLILLLISLLLVGLVSAGPINKKTAQVLKQAGISGTNLKANQISIQGDTVTITNGKFIFKGSHFSKGKIVIKNGEIISAKEIEVDFFQHQGMEISGNFDLQGKTITINKGILELGSSTLKNYIIKARKETVVTSTMKKGYTGTISAVDGSFVLRTYIERLDEEQVVYVAGKVQLIDGKIVSGDDVAASNPVEGLFFGIDDGIIAGLME